MKVTYSWLKDFVDIKIPARELADKLTMAGLEVVSLEERAGDFIFEIEITSNRPDWLSVLGVAREIAAITGVKLQAPGSRLQAKSTKGNLKIEIPDKKDCPLYTARIIRNVKVGPSPDWLSKRLELVGCRSVNNVVDITNYVLFELGEPLHAFDLDKINSEKIIVRRAKAGERLTTIDEQERKLGSNVLVVADKNKAVAIAGVMGGKDSEVSFNTKNILLEAAVFNPVVTRRSRQELGLQSESSYRFERGVDLEMAQKASLRAKELIQEYCAGEEISFSLSGSSKSKETKVDLDVTYTPGLLGAKLTPLQIKQILSGLGFKVKAKAKSIFSVGVPCFRQDVRQPVDLIEEVARIFGYEKIPLSLPAIKPDLTKNESRELVAGIKNILVGLGVNEVITYSLTDKAVLNSLGLGNSAKPIEVLNPLSQEQEVLRPTLIPGLSRCVAFNLNQKQDYVSIFEIANIFQGGEKPGEELTLACALCGTQSFFSGQGLVKDEANLLHLKGTLEAVFQKLGVSEYEFINQEARGVGVYIKKEKIGLISSLSQQALDKLNIKNKGVFVSEISLAKLFTYARPDKKFQPLSKYPGINRDISFILKEELSVKEILAVIKEKAGGLLSDIRVTDYYRGTQIPAGFRGLTLSCFYASNERTLTEEEVQPLHSLLCATLTREFGAKIR